MIKGKRVSLRMPLNMHREIDFLCMFGDWSASSAPDLFWLDVEIVQQAVGQSPCKHDLALLDLRRLDAEGRGLT